MFTIDTPTPFHGGDRPNAGSVSPTSVGTTRQRRRATPTSAALTFVAAQVPLAATAIALHWPETDNTGSVAGDVLLFGSPISGPAGAQVVLLVLAWLASRRRPPVRALGRSCIAVLGVLITVQGVLGATADPRWAPHAVAVIGGIGFIVAGLTLSALALTAMLVRDERRPASARATL